MRVVFADSGGRSVSGDRPTDRTADRNRAMLPNDCAVVCSVETGACMVRITIDLFGDFFGARFAFSLLRDKNYRL